VKVSVNMDRCVGHGMCRMACPEVFALNDEDGKAIVLQSFVPAPFQPAVEQAERGCPEGAVIIEYQ
jgi:ferredoxin